MEQNPLFSAELPKPIAHSVRVHLERGGDGELEKVQLRFYNAHSYPDGSERNALRHAETCLKILKELTRGPDTPKATEGSADHILYESAEIYPLHPQKALNNGFVIPLADKAAISRFMEFPVLRSLVERAIKPSTDVGEVTAGTTSRMSLDGRATQTTFKF